MQGEGRARVASPAAARDLAVSLGSRKKETLTVSAPAVRCSAGPIRRLTASRRRFISACGRRPNTGMEPCEVLQAATCLPAKAFGVLAEPGTVEPGKPADLALVTRDP